MTSIKGYARSEELEAGQMESVEARALDDATHDAGAHVEQTLDHEQAEAIEGVVAQLAGGGQEQVACNPIPLPDGAEEVGATADGPDPALAAAGQEEVENLPVPLPIETDPAAVGESEPAALVEQGQGDGDVYAEKDVLPHVSESDGEGSD